MGTPDHLAPHILTRFRRTEIVAYIAHPLPVRELHKIAEIVVGPAAPLETDCTLRTVLRSTAMSGDFPPVLDLLFNEQQNSRSVTFWAAQPRLREMFPIGNF